MMKLSQRKTRLQFTTDAEIRYRGKMRAVIVEVSNGFHANVRLQGTQQRYPFSWHGVFDYAVDLFARQEIERRKKERKERKAQRCR
jgi:hypothetical protein